MQKIENIFFIAKNGKITCIDIKNKVIQSIEVFDAEYRLLQNLKSILSLVKIEHELALDFYGQLQPIAPALEPLEQLNQRLATIMDRCIKNKQHIIELFEKYIIQCFGVMLENMINYCVWHYYYSSSNASVELKEYSVELRKYSIFALLLIREQCIMHLQNLHNEMPDHKIHPLKDSGIVCLSKKILSLERKEALMAINESISKGSKCDALRPRYIKIDRFSDMLINYPDIHTWSAQYP